MNTFVNYAHRGASAYAPENTMAAFKKAFQIGTNGIELDLQKTKDEKIVIFHDDKIDEKSNGTGKISDYTYKELLEFDFGSWFSEEFENEKIVLFEDFMKEVSSKDLILAIELKEEGIEKETLEIIKKYKDGVPINQLSKEYGKSKEAIKTLLNFYNIPIISSKERCSHGVYQLDDDNNIIKKYNSLTEASISIGIGENAIGRIKRACNEKWRKVKGFHWSWVDSQ